MQNSQIPFFKMASLQPIFSYLGHLAAYDKDDHELGQRTHSFSSYRQLRRKRPLLNRYGFFSTWTFDGYMTKGFGYLMDVVSGRRLFVLLSLILVCWMVVFIRLSFVEVWRDESAVETYRRDIRKNMDDMDSSLKAYRLIRPLNANRHFHVRTRATSLDSMPSHGGHFKKKVLIFGYKRGGASIFAEVFNQDPNAMLWYEVLDPFYVARFGVNPNISPKRVTENNDRTDRDLVRSERKWLSDYFRHIYFCQTENIPLELILHDFMMDMKASHGFRQCVSGLSDPYIDKTMDNCSADVQSICGPSVDQAIRMQCPTILNAGMALRETIREMAGDLDQYLADDNVTQALEREFDRLLGAGLHSLPSGFHSRFPIFLQHQFCLAKLERTLRPCQAEVENACKGKTLGVAHVVRLKSEDLRFILRDFPTMNLVFYVRDPRSMAHSRISLTGEGKKRHFVDIGKRVVDEAMHICTRMLQDYWELVKMQSKFPKVSFIIAKYEDMVLYPYELALEFYNHIGLWLPESYKMYVETHMIVDKAEYLFGSDHPGGNDTLHHWRDILSHTEIKEMNRHCRDVLDLFQYSR